MDIPGYLQTLNQQTFFDLRRAVERVRAGIFDSLAVRLLTVHEEKLSNAIEHGFQAMEDGKASHLCIKGSYGQGKSHSLFFVRERGMSENYVTSTVNLDIRELPLHNIRLVYSHLVRNIRLPDNSHTLVSRWKGWIKERGKDPAHADISSLIPDEIPHIFRAVMVGLAQKNISLSERKRGMKKYASFRPTEIPHTLERALSGDIISTVRLKNALKYREVPFYRDHPLSFQGADIYINMLLGLSKLFKQMGYKGWIILFDEGESVSQLRVSARALSYRILDRLFSMEESTAGLYPVFAFTDDFFTRVEEEDYNRKTFRRGEELPRFCKNYSDAWKNLNIHTLQDFSKAEWYVLAERLLYLYIKAYQWNPRVEDILPQLKARSAEMSGEETRYIFKAMIEHLDVLAF